MCPGGRKKSKCRKQGGLEVVAFVGGGSLHWFAGERAEVALVADENGLKRAPDCDWDWNPFGFK